VAREAGSSEVCGCRQKRGSRVAVVRVEVVYVVYARCRGRYASASVIGALCRWLVWYGAEIWQERQQARLIESHEWHKVDAIYHHLFSSLHH